MKTPMTKPAILVFAYHDVGYECLDALIQNDEYVLSVITHKDDPDEEIWFRSLAGLAKKYGIPVHTPETVNTPDWIARIRSRGRDLIFCFYYRDIISVELLSVPLLGPLTEALDPITRRLGWSTKLKLKPFIEMTDLKIDKVYKLSRRSLYTVLLGTKTNGSHVTKEH